MWTYNVCVQGMLDEYVFNATSPLAVMVLAVEEDGTRCAARTDQSGLIGLLRHLHRQGFVLLSVQREPVP